MKVLKTTLIILSVMGMIITGISGCVKKEDAKPKAAPEEIKEVEKKPPTKEEVIKETLKTMKKDIPKDIPGYMKVFIKKLGSDDPRERAASAYYLGCKEEKAKAAVPFLIELLLDNETVEDSFKRISKDHMTTPSSEAAQALGKIGDIRALEPLIAVLEDPYVRMSAVNGLILLGDKRAVDPLIKLLSLDDNESKIVIYNMQAEFTGRAIAAIGGTDATDRLIGIVKDSNNRDEVRFSSFNALAKIGDKRAIKPLIEMLKEKDDTLEFAIMSTLQILTGEFFEKDKEKWILWYEENKDIK